MAKQKKRTARAVEPEGAEAIPPRPSRAPSPPRQGVGREGAPPGEPSGHDLIPSQSEVFPDFLQFVEDLRANAGEAMRFVEDKVSLRLAAPSTAHAETRFRTRAERLAQAFRNRKAEFQSLDARCRHDDPCRPLITVLGSGGLPRTLDIVEEEMMGIATRAATPLSDEDREELLLDAAALVRILTALLDIADVIAREAKAIRDDPVVSLEGRPTLPQELVGKILESEQAAQRFCDVLNSHPPLIERSTNETTLGWLSRVREEYKRLRDGTDEFAGALRKFSDADRDAAERAGHNSLLSFLREKERVLTRSTARRNVSVSLFQIAIDRVIHRLSLSERGIDAADRVVMQLSGIAAGLAELRRVSELESIRATADRLAEEAAVESDLPEWDVIVQSRPKDGSQLSGLDMLVAAFREEAGGGDATFGEATKDELAERLVELFPHHGPFAESWVNRHLNEAIRRKIAIRLPVEKNRCLPHVFRLTAAAIRKYGPHLPADRRRGV